MMIPWLVVAEEVRHILAELGYRSLSEIIGRGDLVRARTDVNLKKVKNLDVSYVLDSIRTDSPNADDRSWLKHGAIIII